MAWVAECRGWAGWGSKMALRSSSWLLSFAVFMLAVIPCSCGSRERVSSETHPDGQLSSKEDVVGTIATASPHDANDVNLTIDHGASPSPTIQLGSEALAKRLLAIATKACTPDPGFTPVLDVTELNDKAITVSVYQVLDSVSGSDFAGRPSRRAMIREFLETDLRPAIGSRELTVIFPRHE